MAIKELKLDELTIDQKLGMVITAHVTPYDAGFDLEKNLNYTLDLIRNHAVGCVWINPTYAVTEEYMRRIKETADYPILIVTDAESGLKPYMIGQHGSLGMTGSTEHAYIFGKLTGIIARKMGYNMICDPVVDIGMENAICNGVTRRLGGDADKVSQMAVAIAKGIHDAGVISLAKHYPGVHGSLDTHMANSIVDTTEKELLNYQLKPYLALMKEGLLDAIMAGHTRLSKIDAEYPTTLSEKVLGVIRRQGFDGVIMTDALGMFAVVSRYGRQGCKGMAIAAGCDTILGFHAVQDDYEALKDAYRKGVLTDERLDEAVRRILALQHKAMVLQQNNAPLEVSPEDEQTFSQINHNSIAAILDEGTELAIDPNGRHFFAVLEKNLGVSASDNIVPSVDTFQNDWYRPDLIKERIMQRFPNSCVMLYNEFPTPQQSLRMFNTQLDYDDVIFVTFIKGGAFVGKEEFTAPIRSVMEALQATNRISTIVHFGNPFLLEETPHIARRIIGCRATENNLFAIDTLAGLHPAKGIIPYRLNLK